MRITSTYTCKKDRGGCGKVFTARKSIYTLDQVTCPLCGANHQRSKKMEGGSRIPIIERHKVGIANVPPEIRELAEAVDQINEATEPVTVPEEPKSKAVRKDAKSALLRKAKGAKNGGS